MKISYYWNGFLEWLEVENGKADILNSRKS